MITVAALDPAFRAALFLTGRADLAEDLVSEAIAALDPGDTNAESIVVRTVESAIRRTGFPYQTNLDRADLPAELQQLAQLAALARGCFVLRILFGLGPATCALLLNLSLADFETALCAGLGQLPALDAESFCSSMPLMQGNLLECTRPN